MPGDGVRPVLLLDVDGVLNPYAASTCPDGYEEHDLFAGEEPVRLCSEHGAWLRELALRFDLAWASGWGGPLANRLLAPLLGIPALPAVPLPSAPFPPQEKVPAIARYCASRPAAWFDDQLTPHAVRWGEQP
jgi:hypothetical protein